jgi:hypothetical protein
MDNASLSLFSLILCVIPIAQVVPPVDWAVTQGEVAVDHQNWLEQDVKLAGGLPSAEAILSRFVDALGGRQALQKQTSLTIKGSYEVTDVRMNVFNLIGTFKTYTKAPDKSATIIQVRYLGIARHVVDGTRGWYSNFTSFNSPVREIRGAELAAAIREADFYLPLNFRKHFPKVVVIGKKKVGSSEAYVVEATPPQRSPERFYFDVNTGLLVKHDTERYGPDGASFRSEEYLTDYRGVNGVKVAHTLKQVTPKFTNTLKVKSVEYNGEIEERIFDRPDGD